MQLDQFSNRRQMVFSVIHGAGINGKRAFWSESRIVLPLSIFAASRRVSPTSRP